MIVTCNECDSSFNVDDSLIKDGGSKVRCSKCSSVFVVYPEVSGSELGEDADDLALEMDDGLAADLDSDGELADLAMDSGADDELPDLDDMMDFEDDGLSVEASAEEDSADFDFDMEMDEDDSDALGEDEDLDQEDLDLGFDLNEESMAELDESESDDFETDDTDLPDLEMDLADLDEAEEFDTAEAKSDMDLDLEADEELAAAAEDGGDELDLSDLEDLVDSDTEMDLEDVTIEADEAVEGADQDLEMDLAGLDEAEEFDTAEAKSDMDLDLASDEEPVVAVEDGGDELDLSDLEDLVAADADMGLEGAAIESTEDVDLDLDLEPEPEAEAVAADSDELDLSDLDDIIDSGEEPAGEDLSAEAADELDLDLDLDLEAEPAAEAPAGDLESADELDLEGIVESDDTSAEATDDIVLDFEVAEEAVSPAATQTPPASDSEELEMSDLEKMLEPDEKPGSPDTDELDLDLDLESVGEAAAGSVASAAEPAGSDEAEFLDIEKMLEEGDETAPADQGSEDLVEIDLDAVMDEASQTMEPELELNLDLEPDDSSLNISATAEDDLEFNLLDSDEETLQFGATQAAVTQVVDELAESSDMEATTDDFSTDEFAETRDDMGQTDLLDDVYPGPAMGGRIKTRNTRKPLLVAVLLLLLCILGIIVTNNLGIKIPFVSDIQIPYISDIKIPYLNGLLKSEAQDIAGNLKISPLGRTISAKFIENTRAGKIFVIVGQVRNEYDHPRSNIKITGKLYQNGKALVKSATVYCGNMLSDADLARMDIRAIGKRLQNRFGDNRSNIKVKTGKTIPFVIVFNELPANVDEYTVEVAGSSS